MKRPLTDEEWFELHCKTKSATEALSDLLNFFESIYGKNSRQTKLTKSINFDNRYEFCTNVDYFSCVAYPLNVNELPRYPDIKIIKIMLPDYNPTTYYSKTKPLKKSLTDEEKTVVNNRLEIVKEFIEH